MELNELAIAFANRVLEYLNTPYQHMDGVLRAVTIPMLMADGVDLHTAQRALAHLWERGLIQDTGGMAYAITNAGRRELQRIHQTPEYIEASIKTDIARHEAALVELRARLTNEPVDSGAAVKRGLAARFHEGD
jgi:Mn-dependent DtxR family transcriptional regulator